MKQSIVLSMDDEQLIELRRILLDEDAPAALDFLNRHVRSQTAALLDGRPKVKVNVRGADQSDEGADPARN